MAVLACSRRSKTFWTLPAGNLSGGQKQMLSVARALIEPRRLILIDEPTKGLAPAIVKSMIAAIAELKRTNTTILLVEQNFAMARQVGDTVAVMDDGRIVHTGAMAALAADAALQERLMGLEPGGAPMSDATIAPHIVRPALARAARRRCCRCCWCRSSRSAASR